MSSEDRGSSFFLGLVIGGLVGAAIALLMAPQAGEETRERLREKGIELKDRADELTLRARGGAEDILARGRETLDERAAALRQAYEEGKAAAARTANELQARFNEAKEKGPSN